MKQLLIILALTCSILPGVMAQTDEAAQLILNVEKLAQLKQILSDLEKGYRIVSKGYGTIKDLSQGNFQLHKTFLDGLAAVSPAVKKYHKVAGIIDYQMRLVREYKAAIKQFKASDCFLPEELDYMTRVYERLFKSSLKNLDDLTMVLTESSLKMSDDERLAQIDRIYADIQDQLSFLRHFNRGATVLGVQRAKEQVDRQRMNTIYGF